MASLHFYAGRDDMIAVMNFVFTETDCRVFESYSKFGCELREFKSTDEIASVPNFGFPIRTADSVSLQLWSLSASSEARIERIALSPKHCDGHTFRYCINGWGLMKFDFSGVRGRTIQNSYFGHNSEKRARGWEDTYRDQLAPADSWDWEKLGKISGKIRYHVGKRIAAGKVGSRPILPAAFKMYSEGYELDDAFGIVTALT